ncbi:MAG: DNA recombination protein RmuC [Candidatus Omnitrophota bacterium]|nr:DNA recombination protein RmuC [Candidatus Omnitrophota bacterium]
MVSLIILVVSIVNVALLFFLISRETNRGREQEKIERLIREEMGQNRLESSKNLEGLTQHLLKLTDMNEQKLEKIREVVEFRLKTLQEDNNRKLEQMRETVDEKLHSTLEKRLGDSFKIVSDLLGKVHQGLGEMQTLASGVGDLKKVLTNVKTRGIWGEIQLGNLLEQMLTADQYEKNVVTKLGSRDPVEFAIKLPGKDGSVVYIPIDAKFPKEDYERLLAAQEECNIAVIEEAGKAIESRIKLEAKKIREKYIDPPHTTDFAFLYLPIEGLYAEVLRRPGLSDILQREYRVSIAGPTTISAILNALQMGFRTLAVEKRAGDVWRKLGDVKNEFGKFGEILQKTKEKLDSASKSIDLAASKSRTIERKLKDVQDLPSPADQINLIEEQPTDPSRSIQDDVPV